MKHIRKILLLSLFAVLVLVPSKAFALTRVSNLTELQSALAGDDDEIVVTQAIDITENTTIDGHDKKIRAEVTGVNSQGIVNDNASDYNIFTISSANITLKIKDIYIYGGGTSIIYTNKSGVTLNIDNAFLGFAGSLTSVSSVIDITTNDKVILEKCNIENNVADYDSVMYIPRSSSVIMNAVSISNNRSLGSTTKGGGAIENKGILYINNSTFANNYANNVGGAIYNTEGTLYMMNTTVSGNVVNGDVIDGGGIRFTGGGIDGTKLYMTNSIVSGNYSLKDGVFSASDLGEIRYSTDDYIDVNHDIISKTLDLSAEEFNNQLVSYEIDTVGPEKVFDLYDVSLVSATGVLSTNTYKQPVGQNSNDFVYVWQKDESYGLTKGVYTFFDYDNTGIVKMSYGTTTNASSSTALGSLNKGTTLVSNYGKYNNREVGVMGSAGLINCPDGVYRVSSVKSEHGIIVGASLFGEYYDVATTLYFMAVPDYGYSFQKYEEYVNGSWVDLDYDSETGLSLFKNTIIRAIFVKNNSDDDTPSNTPEEIVSNPNTGDNIVIYGGLFVISLLSLGICFKLRNN